MAFNPDSKATNTAHPDWRRSQLGRLLGHAMRRFDERVLYLMAHQPQVPLALSNLSVTTRACCR